MTTPIHADPIQNEIEEKGLNAPRVRPEDLESEIVGEYSFTAAQALGSGVNQAMVQRFLGWRLPEDFRPDGGISFAPVGNAGTPHEYPNRPSGTNLLHAEQAKAMLEHVIAGAPVLPPLERLTICVLVLKNGITVTGQSACVSPENFDAEIGRKIARKNAVEQLWPLLGFRLADKLAKDENPLFRAP